MSPSNCRIIDNVKRKGCVFLFFIIQAGCLAQSSGSLSGRVINSKTKEAVPLAAVFLARTLIGTTADELGAYHLAGIPYGKYDLLFLPLDIRCLPLRC